MYLWVFTIGHGVIYVPNMAVAEWLDPQADRVLARQGRQVDTAKLLATFAAGVAATVVASALQVAPVTDYDRYSVWALCVSIVLAVAVVLLDRLREADHHEVATLAALNGWSSTQFLVQLQGQTLWALTFNEKVVGLVRHVLLIQIVVAALAGIIATLSLLG
jgi:hypothetical protein